MNAMCQALIDNQTPPEPFKPLQTSMRMTYREAKERFDNHHETVQFSDSESDEFYLREIQRIED